MLYDDLGRYEQAMSCLRRVLVSMPNHPRARLFLKDADASKVMFYDEDQAKRVARRNAVLDIPVTDFELSVRARNCLKKMNVRTLGNLVRTNDTDCWATRILARRRSRKSRTCWLSRACDWAEGAKRTANPAVLPR